VIRAAHADQRAVMPMQRRNAGSVFEIQRTTTARIRVCGDEAQAQAHLAGLRGQIAIVRAWQELGLVWTASRSCRPDGPEPAFGASPASRLLEVVYILPQGMDIGFAPCVYLPIRGSADLFNREATADRDRGDVAARCGSTNLEKCLLEAQPVTQIWNMAGFEAWVSACAGRSRTM